jgi:hypothetical protein
MPDCSVCQQLSAEWRSATETLRRMKRSAIVWEYGAQTRLVEERYAAYAAHQASAHVDAETHSDELAKGTPRPMHIRQRRRLPRSVLINGSIALAVLALVVVLLFLHIA